MLGPYASRQVMAPAADRTAAGPAGGAKPRQGKKRVLELIGPGLYQQPIRGERVLAEKTAEKYVPAASQAWHAPPRGGCLFGAFASGTLRTTHD